MNSDFHLSLSLLLLPILVFIGGVLLVWHARRRVGVTPHCGKCDYLLVGNESAVCPECGQGLTEGNIVLGERVRPGRLRLGWVTILVGLLGVVAVFTPAAWRYDWYRVRPLSWVIQDAGSRDAVQAKRAWNEMSRRRSVGRLAAGDEKQVVEFALREQAAVQEGAAPSPILAEILGMLGERAVDGQLSDLQMKRFMENAIRFHVRVRSNVAAGKACAVEWSATTCAPRAGFWVEVRDAWLDLDDRRIPGGGMESTQEFDFGTETHFQVAPAPGDYPVTVTEHVRVWAGKDGQKGKLLHEWQTQAATTLHVRETLAADDLKLIDRPELLPAMKAAISVNGWKVEGQGLSIQLRIVSPPENVAFEIFAKSNGTEYPLGSVTLEKGKETSFYLGSEPIDGFMDRGAMDIVLRSNAAAAQRTVDLHQIWKGEIILKDVPYLPRKGG